MSPQIVAPQRAPETKPQPAQVNEAVVCLPAGTIVLTQDGEIPVEYLEPGDRIITRDAGLVTLLSVERETCLVHAVKIAAGSLGDMRPEDDLILPAAQPVLIRDWRAQAMFGTPQAVVAAGALVDDAYVCDMGKRRLGVCLLHFATPHVIYAGGLELGCAERANALTQAA